MCESEIINLENPMHRFCVSWFALNVARVGTALFISSWNEHRIPGIALHVFIVSITFWVKNRPQGWLRNASWDS